MTDAFDYDMLVIGSGPAGHRAAIQAAKLKHRVAIVEKRAAVGGVCINTGTIPSKTMREAVLHLSGYRERALYGAGKNKLDRNRFGGKATAAGGPLETLDAEEVRKRHLTMASRHQRKERQQRREKGPNLASRLLASDLPQAADGGQQRDQKQGGTMRRAGKPATSPQSSPAPAVVDGAGHSAASEDVPF